MEKSPSVFKRLFRVANWTKRKPSKPFSTEDHAERPTEDTPAAPTTTIGTVESELSNEFNIPDNPANPKRPTRRFYCMEHGRSSHDTASCHVLKNQQPLLKMKTRNKYCIEHGRGTHDTQSCRKLQQTDHFQQEKGYGNHTTPCANSDLDYGTRTMSSPLETVTTPHPKRIGHGSHTTPMIKNPLK